MREEKLTNLSNERTINRRLQLDDKTIYCHISFLIILNKNLLRYELSSNPKPVVRSTVNEVKERKMESEMRKGQKFPTNQS